MTERTVRVLIVDDQTLMREGLKTLLDMDARVEVVGEATDGVEGLEKVNSYDPRSRSWTYGCRGWTGSRWSGGSPSNILP